MAKKAAVMTASKSSRKEAPEYWAKLPQWFKENNWLIQNQEHLFVRRIGNALAQIMGDISVKRKGDAPMDATRSFLSGDDAANATKFQYAEALKEMKTLTGGDLKKAQEVLQKFKDEFSEYMPHLE